MEECQLSSLYVLIDKDFKVWWEGDLDRLTKGQIEGLVAGLERERGKQVPPVDEPKKKLGNPLKTRNRGVIRWEKDLNPYNDYDIGIKVPGYLVALLSEEEDPAKVLISLLRSHYADEVAAFSEVWAVGMEAEVQDAEDRFTSRFDLE